MKRPAKASRSIIIATILVALASALGGCKTVNTLNSRYDMTLGKKREVESVHQESALPEHLRRVAVLPIYRGRYDHIDMDSIEENFRQEINKRNLFETVSITRETMEQLFGSSSYSSIEPIPTQLLGKLHATYAIDGVLLLDLSYYSAYQPVGLGVRAKLFDGHSGEIVWAADELFDSSDPAVSNAARKYFQTESVSQYPLQKTQTVLHSPTRFSKYVAAALFSTIQ